MNFRSLLPLLVMMPTFALAGPAEIKLWPEGKGGDGAEKVSLFAHLPGGEKRGSALRPAVIVCPGGGYGGVVMSYEGHEVAKWFVQQGFVAFVLKYRVAPHRHPLPMHDVQRAVQWVRSSAGEHQVDPQRIGVIGFSAGGHLAATAGTKVAAPEAGADDPVLRVSSRPDFMVLAYPVISMAEGVGHAGSRRNLLGAEAGEPLVESMSLEKQVTAKTPPTFLFHTSADTVVHVENSLRFYAALKRAGVDGELHVYREGPHGVGLDRHPGTESWPGLLKTWLQRSGFAGK